MSHLPDGFAISEVYTCSADYSRDEYVVTRHGEGIGTFPRKSMAEHWARYISERGTF